MRITALQKLMGIVLAVGFGYLVCDYYHLFADEPMYALQGRIRLEGRPLYKGTIHFVPIEADHNKTAAGTVLNGEYTVPQQYGLLPGRYQVQVSSLRHDDIMRNAIAKTNGDESYEIKEEVPERFNLQSEIYVDLTKGDVLELDLDLK